MKIKKTKGIIPWILISAIPVLIISCYPGGPSTPEEKDIVGTSYDKEFNFGAVVTFSLPDTIVHMVTGNEQDSIGRDYDNLIFNRVRDQMITLGYIERPVDTLNPADVVLLISAMSTTNSGLYFDTAWWWGYWGWWPGWGGHPGAPVWGPGWGYGFPVGVPIYINYTSGTLFITMIDPANSDVEEKTIAVPWLAALNSLLSGGSQDKEQRITDNIDQAFKQSPYLVKN
jgi:hypothetical protein